MAIFPGGSGLADTSIHTDVSILDFIGVKDDGGGGADNWSYKIWKFQSYHHHQQTNTQRFIGQMPFLSPNEQCHSTRLKKAAKTDRPNPATQWTATQLPGWAQNLSRSSAKKRSTTSGGGGVPSSNGKSYTRRHTHVDQHESTPYLQLRLVGWLVFTSTFSTNRLYRATSSSSSSSDRVDSRGPLRQPRVATTTSLGPFGTNAEGCTVADLLDPWMVRASWPSPPTRTKTGASSCCYNLW